MKLDVAINSAKTCQDFLEIFNCDVTVQIDTSWGVDTVTVSGYKGNVSTDVIARKVFNAFFLSTSNGRKEEFRLAHLLKKKVFKPLRDLLIQLDSSNCTTTLFYKVRNFSRIGWTPEDSKLTAGYFVLRHSMCVMVLNDYKALSRADRTPVARTLWRLENGF